MALLKIKAGNKTVALFSGAFVILGALISLSYFEIIKMSWRLFTPLGVAVILGIYTLAMILETYFEGEKVNIAKDRWALMNTILSAVTAIIAIIILLGSPAIVGLWAGVVGTIVALDTIFLGRELVFD